LKKGSGSADAGIPEVPGLSVLETEFIAGLMNHLKSVVAFTLPTFGSYERLMDGTWAVVFPFVLSNDRVALMYAGEWRIGRLQYVSVHTEPESSITSKSSVLMAPPIRTWALPPSLPLE